MQVRPIQVLLVEDESPDVEFAKRALAKAAEPGFQLSHCDRLSSAAEHLRSGRFDVLLLDLGLPECCDLEALAELRKVNREIPIVVLTGLRNERIALAALEQGAQDYLVKGSLTADTLARSIHFAIQRQQLLAVTIDRELSLHARARLAAIVEDSDDAIIGETLDGEITDWNQGAEKMYGYGAAEAVGRNVSFLFPPAANRPFEQVRAAARQGRACRSFETEFVHRDGRSIEISLSISPIRDRLGKIIGISKIGRDLRHHKRVEQALQNSQERLEMAVRGSNDGLGDWCLATGEACWSPRMREMLGYGGEVANEFEDNFSAVTSRMHPDDRERVVAEIAQGIAAHVAVRTEFRLRTRSGEYRWFQGRGRAVYDPQGRPYHFAGAMTDITDRKKLELELAERDEQLRQSHKLEAVGSLAGGIAHEFNNLLQAICGYTRYAMNGLDEAEQRCQDLQQVLKAADRAASLTRELLGFSRRQMLERGSIDPGELVDDLVRMLRPLIGEQIDLQVVLAPDVGLLHGDRGLLQQMLLNLCINARDAMPDGGPLVLKTQRAVLSEHYCALHPMCKPGTYVLFSVSDAGCGIPPEIRQRIFEPFFTTKEVGKGTGLGLAMVYGCVEQHGGLINVYSEPNLGTTFRVYLPLGEAVEPEAGATVVRAVAGGSETILVAEDEPIVRDLTVRILKDAGYRVLAAADGAEAVELLEAHADEISLVLLDAVMPKLTGHQAYDRIKFKNPHLPVVFCSGYDPEMGQVKLLLQEGVRMVQKPFDPDQLLTILREVLDARVPSEASACAV
ncbi:MAG TPA: response regulator [Pirellulales bacterium]|nr:response regulator [Pirellulales bacterium]